MRAMLIHATNPCQHLSYSQFEPAASARDVAPRDLESPATSEQRSCPVAASVVDAVVDSHSVPVPVVGLADCPGSVEG